MRKISKYVSILSIFLTLSSGCPMTVPAAEETAGFKEPVIAEDILQYEETDESEPVVTEDVCEEEADIHNDDPEDLLTAETTQGDITDPIPYMLGTEVQVNFADGNKELYYEFSIDKPGYVEPFVKKADDVFNYMTIEIYSDSVNDLNLVFWNDNSKKEYKDLGRTGLKPGKYVVKLSHTNNPATGCYFKIRYTQTDDYEEELDSKETSKPISLGKTYYGECSPAHNDNVDYYTFELAKASKITVHAKTSDNYYLGLTLYGSDGTKIKGDSGGEFSYSVQCEAGTYYIEVTNGLSATSHNSYLFTINSGSGKKGDSKKSKKTGTASMNGVTYDSLKAAFKDMKEAKDYTVDLVTDMDGEGNLTIPKKPTSVTINGNGHKIKIIGSKLTSNANLKLNNVSIATVKKSGSKAKFTLNAKKDLEIGEGVAFDTLKTVIKVGKELKLTGDLNASSITAGTLNIEGGNLTVNKDNKVTVKTAFKSLSGNIILGKDFNKPITLKGSAEGLVKIKGEKQPDGTQILASKQNKIDPETLKKVFDVKEITDNENETSLFYYKKGKAGIFGESIQYKDKSYGLWKDAVAQMNADKGADSQFEVTLTGDVNAGGALTMPKKGYSSISVNTIDGKTFKLTFTGNIKLTGDTSISDRVTLTKVNKKGSKVSGKVIKKKYKYTGKESF